ncbi:sensor histidine kinase [Archangium lansingense]|uniref:histidine kinase n=1 Tax=Archangium lansingense TaxID=2995310 RepID=A0ABT4ABQ8_9BACT|nr:ATP-binding protein [Archangium lansinium]MCY1078339.1 ATP-binding protein [Archangium lansinium]
MDAHVGSAAPEGSPRKQGGTASRRARLLYVPEILAITGVYLLLTWLGMNLMPDGRLLTIWPAGGFALAMLLLRGTSRWPAVLLGSLLAAWLFAPKRWVVPGEVPISALQHYTAALLMGVGRAFATVVSVWLIRRYVGTMRWPHTVRGVLGFVIIGGLVHSALVALTSHFVLLAAGIVELGPAFLREAWIWFNANTAGVLVVTTLILALSEGPTGRPRRSRREVVLAAALTLAAILIALEFQRWFGEVGIQMTYLLTPLMIWMTLRFGAQGAVLTNLMWATVTIYSLVFMNAGEVALARTFAQYQARLVVFNAVILVLAAAFEERHLMREALEKERENLEGRVAERTRELARFLSLLHSSLESTADGLLVVDRKGHITAVNQRFARLWRLPPSVLESSEDALALTFVRDQLVEPEAFASRVKYLYAHPELESEDEIQLEDGRVFERFSRPQCLGEEVVGRVWSFRDITSRRRAEAERDRLLVEESRARQEAERAFHEVQRALGMRDEFLSIAAHEMKTPLTSMKMQIQLLLRVVDGAAGGQVDAARLRPPIAAALRQMRRFQELSDQLLDITQLSTGRLVPRYEPLDFRKVVVEQIEQQAEAAAKARTELRLACADPIPGECDRQCFERIVCALLSNAIKFGAGAPIFVRLEAQAERVRLQVVDHGIGVAPEDHARIFERLERAVDARHYGGLGLGLWLARQSAEVLGGDISVESEPGRGSTFTVELPRLHQSPSLRGDGPAAEQAQPSA